MFLPYWGGGGGGGVGIQPMMICYYFSFFIDEIWLDNILFILFSVLAELNLTCRTWASPVIQGRPLGPSGSGPHFALEPKGLGYRMGRTTSLGLASGPVSPFF